MPRIRSARLTFTKGITIAAAFTRSMTENEFKTADWVCSTNLYEVNLRQYTAAGTLQAFQKELPRLKAMGVDALWFMPVTPISLKNRKGTLGSYYACSDYVSVNPEFGTLSDFRDTVKMAHGMGFKVILDWVANHTGWDHVWTIAHPEFYKTDPYTRDFQMAHGMDDIIELDYGNPSLREAMISAMRFWVEECDIDGFRCDLAFWVVLDFWKEARAALEKEGKVLFWLGEFDPLDNPEYYEAFDAAYTWTWMHKTESFCRKETGMGELLDVLERYASASGNKRIPLWFTTNHDENSWNGTEYEKYNGVAQALSVFSFTTNGMPLVYSGQELPNKKRLDFFEKDTIGWTGVFALEVFFRVLMDLKSRNPALRSADPAALAVNIPQSGASSCIVYARKNGPDEVLVILNLGTIKSPADLSGYALSGFYRNLFSGSVEDLTGNSSFEVEAGGYLVYEKMVS